MHQGLFGESYLIGDWLNYNVDITGNLAHVADLEACLGLVAHQDVTEDELVFILHKQAPTLNGLQDVEQVGAGADLVLLKYGGIIVGDKGWGVEGRHTVR